MKKLVIQLLYFEQLKDRSTQREKRFDSFEGLYDFINHYSFLSGLQAGTINSVRLEWDFEESEG